MKTTVHINTVVSEHCVLKEKMDVIKQTDTKTKLTELCTDQHNVLIRNGTSYIICVQHCKDSRLIDSRQLRFGIFPSPIEMY